MYKTNLSISLIQFCVLVQKRIYKGLNKVLEYLVSHFSLSLLFCVVASVVPVHQPGYIQLRTRPLRVKPWQESMSALPWGRMECHLSARAQPADRQLFLFVSKMVSLCLDKPRNQSWQPYHHVIFYHNLHFIVN